MEENKKVEAQKSEEQAPKGKTKLKGLKKFKNKLENIKKDDPHNYPLF